MTPVAIVGLIMDAALGGIGIATAFAEFRQSRDPGETPEEAAAEYVKEMLVQVSGETKADSVIAEWKLKHGDGS